MPEGAFYAFPNVKGLLNRPMGPNGTTFTTSAELAEALLEEGHVAAVPGEAFGAPGYMRFSYAVADEEITEACADSRSGPRPERRGRSRLHAA